MIWEQGSIVIVNLTRLTENGVSLCHRYWPEEGSDLYHIYEVRCLACPLDVTQNVQLRFSARASDAVYTLILREKGRFY